MKPLFSHGVLYSTSEVSTLLAGSMSIWRLVFRYFVSGVELGVAMASVLFKYPDPKVKSDDIRDLGRCRILSLKLSIPNVPESWVTNLQDRPTLFIIDSSTFMIDKMQCHSHSRSLPSIHHNAPRINKHLTTARRRHQLKIVQYSR